MRGQPFMYQQMPTADQQQPSSLDPSRLEAFRKNWEYYKMWNPQVNYNESDFIHPVFEVLRQIKPRK